MEQRQLTLSADANAFIQEQLETGQFTTPDEVVSKTLEAARQFAARKKLAGQIREAFETEGEEIEFTEEWWARRTAQLREQFEQRRSA